MKNAAPNGRRFSFPAQTGAISVERFSAGVFEPNWLTKCFLAGRFLLRHAFAILLKNFRLFMSPEGIPGYAA